MKIITSENWLTRDPTMNGFSGFSNEEPVSIDGGARFVSEIVQPKLSLNTPDDVKRLYEMARAAICYGYFFYPLYTLGVEQLKRCLDAALKARIEMEKPDQKLTRFSQRVDWAVSRGIIQQSQKGTWDAIRHLRNEGAHSSGSTILLPGNAIDSLYLSAETISSLFPD